jgi:hypothetical protein
LTQAELTLELFHGSERLFASSGRWLHPLFELETFLDRCPVPRRELRIRDKIIGKAAALLIVRLGIPAVHAELLSELGEQALLRGGVSVTHGRRVPRIACQTERLLEDIDDPEEAHRLIQERIEGNSSRPGG